MRSNEWNVIEKIWQWLHYRTACGPWYCEPSYWKPYCCLSATCSM